MRWCNASSMPTTPTTVSSEPATLILDLQKASDAEGLPTRIDLERWIRAALAAGGRRPGSTTELTLRIVDADEGASLNERFRGREGPTNVLSFPFEAPPAIAELDASVSNIVQLIGDLVICAPVVEQEAREQHKAREAHWAHMVVHGVLHLLGHDHVIADEATRMEALETAILGGLGFPPPYEVPTDTYDERPK